MSWFSRKPKAAPVPTQRVYVYVLEGREIRVQAACSSEALTGLRAVTSAKAYTNAWFVGLEDI